MSSSQLNGEKCSMERLNALPQGQRWDKLGRVKKVLISMRVVVSFLHGQNGVPHHVYVPRISNLPDGYLIVQSYPDPQWHSVAVIVQHDSFDEVPEGAEIPRLEPADVEWWCYELATEEEVKARMNNLDRYKGGA